MLRSIGKRVLQTVIVLFCVSLMIFVLLRIIPGDAITTMMGEHANADTIARLTKEMNLDKPFYVQFITYLKDICTGNFGTSYTLNKPVTELLAAAFPNTVKLAVMAAVIAWVIGMVCGIIAAVKKDGILDRLFMGFSLLGVSVPVFMVAMVLQYFIAYKLHWVDISGVKSWTGFILPAIALGWNSAGSIARLTRSTLVEVLQEDYINALTTVDGGVHFPLTVAEGGIFVLGDNRGISKDSRYPDVGQIDKREVLGKAIFLMYPGTDDGTYPREFERVGAIQ